ncbi:HNH endonuclease [Butyrivibrio sp. INlla21]|nr:HNH endonuclease [Butyrivibrio sp. INlla21]
MKDGFAPSIRNKRDRHIDIFLMYHKVVPITKATFEMGQFDTQVLKAIAEGKSLPEGSDYQHGERYGAETLREAVFTRDGYKCICCKRTPFKDGAILHVHHVGFWKGDRTDRLSNLATVCEKCHISKNHKPGGKLYGFEPKLPNMSPATFMTMVRFDMFKRLKELAPDEEFRMTYGAKTKLSRKDLSIKKSHANDAYAMGEFHPRHRTNTVHYEKRRRNNRILSKFYDAKYIDIRDGSIKKGSQLSCGRTKRSIPRNSELNERIYRGKKVSEGRYSIRTQRYSYRPHDIVWVDGVRYTVKGVISNGTRVALNERLPVSIHKIQKIIHIGGWYMS